MFECSCGRMYSTWQEADACQFKGHDQRRDEDDEDLPDGRGDRLPEQDSEMLIGFSYW